MSERNKPQDPSRRQFLLGPMRRLRGESGGPPQGVPARPKASESTLKLGREALEIKDYTTAAEQFDLHVKANPEDAPVRCLLGYCLYQLGRYLHAKIEFERALRVSREDAFAGLGLGLVLLRMNKPDKAKVVLHRLAPAVHTTLKHAMLEICEADDPLDGAVERAETSWRDNLPLAQA